MSVLMTKCIDDFESLLVLPDEIEMNNPLDSTQ